MEMFVCLFVIFCFLVIYLYCYWTSRPRKFVDLCPGTRFNFINAIGNRSGQVYVVLDTAGCGSIQKVKYYEADSGCGILSAHWSSDRLANLYVKVVKS